MSSINSKDSKTPKVRDGKRCEASNEPKAFKTTYELQGMIVEQANALHGPWPPAIALLVFDDADGWTASIPDGSKADNF